MENPVIIPVIDDEIVERNKKEKTMEENPVLVPVIDDEIVERNKKEKTMESPVIIPVIDDEIIEETIAEKLVIKNEPPELPTINLEHRLLWPSERESISTCTCLKITFCPCCILGHVTSRIEREEPCCLSCTNGCRLWSMGRKGWWTCFQTATLSILGGPISPFLSAYVFCQRRHFRTIYVEDTNESTICATCCICFQDVCDSCCLRPCVLWQHFEYLKRKENEGLLRYPWETDVTYDLYRNPIPPTDTKIIFVVGPKGLLYNTIMNVFTPSLIHPDS